MRLIVVCGFLGSGKTSLILGLGRLLAQERGCLVAIIENEINAGGVDGQVLARSGLTVRELSAGCVCCSLRTDLATTLRALADDLHPDVVIIEPSGVAGPGLVIEAVTGVIPGLAAPQVVGLIDATRLPLLLDINPFLVEGLMAAAALVVLNKCDAVETDTLERHRLTLIGIDARPPVLALSCGQEAHARVVLDALDHASAEHVPAGHAGLHPIAAATVARHWRWTRPDAEDQDAWCGRLKTLLVRLAADLPQDLRGHFKLFAAAVDGSWLSAGLTGAETPLIWRGEWRGAAATLQVTLNAIAMGLSGNQLAALIDRRIAADTLELNG